MKRKPITARLNKFQKLFAIILLIALIPTGAFADSGPGNPYGNTPIPPEAQQESTATPDHIIGTGTPESCTAEAFINAVAQGGTIVFNGGSKPFTITLDRPAKVFNNKNPDVVIDGGGLVTLSGGNKTRILYMNTCDPKQVWTTSHAQNQDHPRLTVQNITFAHGNSTGDTEYTGGGAIWIRGGRFKVVNCRFINNTCATAGPDVGGGAIRVFDQYEDLPVYVVNSTFGGAEGLGNSASNGGALSSIGVSWTIINSLLTHNQALGHGGNPSEPGTPGGGSGGAIYNDGNRMTLSLSGTRIEYNRVNAYGSGVFFVTNDHTGDIQLNDTVIQNNIGGSWYPVIPNVSMHADTKLKISNTPAGDTFQPVASPVQVPVVVDHKELLMQAYNINNANYFKLRDLAMALNGTDAQFQLTWTESSRTIALTSQRSYTPTGGELALLTHPSPQPFQKTEPNIIFNGSKVQLTPYNINGSNYFKLREVAALMKFAVQWDAGENRIVIDTGVE